MNRVAALVFIVSLFLSCQAHESKWQGGKITEPGTYEYHDGSLTINIYLENNFVRYKGIDDDGKTVIKYDYNISVFQNWAFYLDEKTNFWVFSSDIGDSVWKKGSGSSYFQTTFNRQLTENDVPESVYTNCKEFFRKLKE